LALLVLPPFVPKLRWWPLYMVVPLAIYFVVVSLIPPLWRTCRWFALGRVNGPAAGATIGIIQVSSSALVLYQAAAQPDVTPLVSRLPLAGLGNTLLAGACFAVLNALLEELIFRGILYDAVAAQWGWGAAVGATAVAFGVGHVNGYPPGWLGSVLAGIYGVMLGLLRWYTRGLVLPVVAHVFADATIYIILVSAGAVGGGG
jgi:membrane protease YdiL (CAAX protease family)